MKRENYKPPVSEFLFLSYFAGQKAGSSMYYMMKSCMYIMMNVLKMMKRTVK